MKVRWLTARYGNFVKGKVYDAITRFVNLSGEYVDIQIEDEEGDLFTLKENRVGKDFVFLDAREEAIYKLTDFLKKKFPDRIQMFDCMNWIGDPTETIYEDEENGISVDYCHHYGYVEVFGLTEEEFDALINEAGYALWRE